MQKHTAEFPNSEYLQEMHSLSLLAFVCLFLNFIMTFFLLQKILLLYGKLLPSLLLTLVKQLLERVQSPIKQVHGDK